MIARELERRAAVYEALATALEAGLDAQAALGLVAERDDAWGRWAQRAQQALQRGEPLSACFETAPSGDRIERRLIEAAERSGQLPELLRRLGSDLERRAAQRRELFGKLLYPIALLHAVVLLPPLGQLLLEGLGGYLSIVLPPLAAGYAVLGVVAGTVWWLRHRAGVSLRERLARAFARWPAIGAAVRARAAARYASVLAALLEAGIGAFEALETAAAVLAGSVLGPAARGIERRVRHEGATLAEAFAAERETDGGRLLPGLLVEAVRVGEQAGRLDGQLERAARALEADALRREHLLLRLFPFLIYLAVALVIAITVVRFYAKLFDALPS